MLYLYETRMTRQVFHGSRQEFEKFICPLGTVVAALRWPFALAKNRNLLRMAFPTALPGAYSPDPLRHAVPPESCTNLILVSSSKGLLYSISFRPAFEIASSYPSDRTVLAQQFRIEMSGPMDAFHAA